MIGTMRQRYKEGVEKRKILSLQIQWMLLDVVTQYVLRYLHMTLADG
jgi:hypothetical protein